jgi:DNA-binding beta-propeller fold protein YncE
VDRQLGIARHRPGQFDTPHGIAVSPKDEIFVADRGNRRIQVFDTSGKYIREFTIDVPVDTKRGKIVYGAEAPTPRPDRWLPARPTRCA